MSYLFYKLKGEMILKLNVIEIVSIFLLAILMLGAVSASDELTADNDIDVLSVNDDSELSIDDNDYGTGEDDILKVSNGDNSDIEDEVDPVLQSEDANDLATGSQNPNIKIYGESGSNNFTYDQFTINNVVIELPTDAGDNFTISVRDKEIPEWTKSYHNWYKNDSKIFLNAYNFYGKFNVTIKYNGNDIYSPCIKTENFTNKAVIVYEDSLIYKEGSTFVELYLPWAASGDLVVVIDGNKTIRENFRDHYDAIEPDERSAVAISPYSLDYGTHSVHAYYDGAYEVDPVDFVINVYGKIIISRDDSITYGNNLLVKLKLSNDAKGTLHASSGNYNTSKPLENGAAIIFIKASDVGVGIHEINAFFISDNENYTNIASINQTAKFKPELSIYGGFKVFESNKISVITHDTNINGNFKIVVDDKTTFSQKLTDGKATISLSSLTAGIHMFKIYYYDDQSCLIGFWDCGENVQKAAAPQLTASALNMYYQDGSAFKVKVVGIDGKVVKNGAVVIKINGKTVKTVKTDAKGYAVYKVTQLPKKYTISATYGKQSVSKKLTVNQPLTLKKVKVKKSAKKLILTAKLKGVKPYAGKKLIFKFKGKTFAKKTNKNGVAKVKIKKSLLKKLKVGKKVTYQVTYLKDTVKKTAKVKR